MKRSTEATRQTHIPCLPLGLSLVLLVLVAGAPGPAAESAGLHVWVSILPQQWFVHQLVSEKAEVHVLLDPGQSPHTYEPSPRQLAALDDADILFTIGVPFESALVPRLREMYPQLRIIDVRRNIELRLIEDGHHHAHHGHEHDRHDPHFWLDPTLAATMAKNMSEALCQIDSANCHNFQTGLGSVHNTLATLDSTIHAMLDSYQGQKLYVYHAAFGYWCDAYGLEQVPIEVGGKQPGPRQVASLIEAARADSVHTIFVQPQFSEASAEAIANALDGEAIAIDPLAADYPDNLLRMAQAVVDGLQNKGEKDGR